MLDINFIRQNPEEVKRGVSVKNADTKLVDDFLAWDDDWKKLTKDVDNFRAEQKKLSKERKINEATEIKEKIRLLENELKGVEKKREEVLSRLPNLPFNDVPVGKDENENKVVREIGKKPRFSARGGFEPKNYLELAEKLELIDVERAAKVSGSRFGYLKNQAALLEFALVKLAFDRLIPGGFIPIVPPIMIKPGPFGGMGRLVGEQKEERYYLAKDDLYLAGSAEHTLGPLHMDEILAEEDLPRRYVGFSTCFRREAGSYGKDTKGILRVHQFDKVEMFSFVKPEDSEKEHQFLLSMQEKLMQALKLPYRVVSICTGDMSWPDAKQYDVETWLPGEKKYRETHSCSNTTDFQARGINARYRNKKGEVNFVHMLNATAFAVGRTIIAIIENCQQKDGSILVPKVLRKYLGTRKIAK